LNEKKSGDLFKNMGKLDYELNRKLVETSVQESSAVIQISKEAIDETVAFYNKTSCAVKQ
jgi:hypothetical protein